MHVRASSIIQAEKMRRLGIRTNLMVSIACDNTCVIAYSILFYSILCLSICMLVSRERCFIGSLDNIFKTASCLGLRTMADSKEYRELGPTELQLSR
jgi:hypothetical protein